MAADNRYLIKKCHQCERRFHNDEFNAALGSAGATWIESHTALTHRRRAAAWLDDELSDHVERQTQEDITAGMAPR